MNEELMQCGLETLTVLNEGESSRSVCAENPTGEKGGGGKSTDGVAKKAARHLGRGWKISPYYEIQPGSEYTLADIDGEGQVESMWFGGDISRNYILRIYWDNEENPGVECPLPEFFAYGWHIESDNPFKGPFSQISSVPIAVNPNKGLNCFWTMPFKKSCKVTIENRSSKIYSCYYQINYCLKKIPENAGYFHAQYRQKCPLQCKEEFVILDEVCGKGKYVGTALFVGLNGEGNWWGEGEIKFYIDGDKEFPTICGTGTEDYFGGSYDWEVDGRYQTYTTPFMGMHQILQPDGLYNHQQRFSMYRWHIMDPIRFSDDLKVTIQDLGWTVPGETYLARRDDFASVAFWYENHPALRICTLPDKEEILVI